MAKTNEQFDQHFREKLKEHQEKPSALAWERLESQLPKQSKPAFGIWWAIAASVTALLVAGYSFWPTDESNSEGVLLAVKTEMPIETQIEPIVDSPAIADGKNVTELKPETEINNSQPEVKPKNTQKTKPTPSPALTQAPQILIAQAENKTTESPIQVAVLELKTEELQVSIPELKAPELAKTVAQSTAPAEDEPLYRVSIYSNGVKRGEPQDKNLITELGKTVGQVEGLLGKVDDGLITLQDKKDNLFASLTSRKSQADEKP